MSETLSYRGDSVISWTAELVRQPSLDQMNTERPIQLQALPHTGLRRPFRRAAEACDGA
jgi:hypothetical protein